MLFTSVPSRPPTAFNLTASSSTSIIASWQLPPVFARHGTIVGFKLFYKKKGSDKPARNVTIRGELTLSKNVTGLDEYTEYEFQVLAYSSDGDGPNSSVEVERTMEDGMGQIRKNDNVIVLVMVCCMFIKSVQLNTAKGVKKKLPFSHF